jgi:hypothetical protein
VLTSSQTDVLPPFPFVCPPGVTAWRAITFESAIPYLVFTHAFKKGRAWVDQTSVLWLDEDVIALCNDIQADKGRRLTDIVALLPVHKGRRSWRLVGVREIFTTASRMRGQLYVTYVSLDGERFGTGPTHGHTEVQRQQIYNVKSPDRSAPPLAMPPTDG